MWSLDRVLWADKAFWFLVQDLSFCDFHPNGRSDHPRASNPGGIIDASGNRLTDGSKRIVLLRGPAGPMDLLVPIMKARAFFFGLRVPMYRFVCRVWRTERL